MTAFSNFSRILVTSAFDASTSLWCLDVSSHCAVSSRRSLSSASARFFASPSCLRKSSNSASFDPSFSRRDVTSSRNVATFASCDCERDWLCSSISFARAVSTSCCVRNFAMVCSALATSCLDSCNSSRTLCSSRIISWDASLVAGSGLSKAFSAAAIMSSTLKPSP